MVEDASGTPAVKYYHDNLIGTTRFMTDASGTKIESAVYTAFGERVNGPARRFGYAGAYGYQTDAAAEMPFLHVGHRYYDPSIGRFAERDPIGLRGGLNVYEYVRSTPGTFVDPLGLRSIFDPGSPDPPKPRPPKRPKVGYSIEEMQRQLDREKWIIMICAAGIGGLVSGGVGYAIGEALGGAAFGATVGGAGGGMAGAAAGHAASGGF
jgi:RHS repeat-associated protein